MKETNERGSCGSEKAIIEFLKKHSTQQQPKTDTLMEFC